MKISIDFSKNYNFSHGLAVATMSNTGRGIIIANRGSNM